MTVITENSELIITLNIIVWCFVVATVIAYVLPMIHNYTIRTLFGLLAGLFTVGFLVNLHMLLLSLNVY